MKLLLVLVAAAVSRLAAPAPAAPEPGGVDAKARYEAALESKVNRLLDEALGPRRARVFVDATLDQSVTEETVERLAREADPEGLPGFHRPAAATARKLSGSPEPVLRLSVRLVEDAGLSRGQAGAAEDLVRQVLSVSVDRGDDLSVVRASLRETPVRLLERPWVRLACAAAGAAFLLAVALILLAARAARRSAVRAFRQIREEQGRWLPAPSGPVIDAPGIPLLPGGRAPAPRSSTSLDFIGPQNLRMLARFLEQRSPGAVRWVLGALDANPAAAVFQLLPAAIRQQAAVELASGTAPPGAEELRQLVAEMRAFVEREEKGPGLLQELLVRSPDSLRQAVMDSLRTQAPASLGRVQAGLLRFGDLERAEPSALSLLARETTSEELALAVRGCRDSLRERLLAALPAVLRESAQRRLRQPSTDEAGALAARAAILTRWKELEACGLVPPL